MGKCRYKYSLRDSITVRKPSKIGNDEFIKIEFPNEDVDDFLECNLPAYSDGKCILHCDKEKINYNNEKLSAFKEAFVSKLNFGNNKIYGIIFPNIPSKFSDFTKIISPFTKNNEDNIGISEIEFYDCHFLNKINISDIKKVKFFTCTINETLIIDEGTYNLEISGSNINTIKLTQEEILYDSYYSFYIGDSIIKNLISEHLVYPYGKLEMYDSKIGNIQIRYANINEGTWFVRNDIGTLKLAEVEYVNNSTLEVKECNIGNLIIDKLHFQPKKFNFINTIIRKEFNIVNSNISNSVLQHVDLRNADIIIINSNLIGENYSKFSNVEWGNLKSGEDANNRDTFRQLKHVNDLQGNYIQANKFYALEMQKYGEEISMFKNLPECFIFVIGKNLSNFSQDWRLPIYWFILMSIGTFNVFIAFTVDFSKTLELHVSAHMFLAGFRLTFIPFILLFIVNSVLNNNKTLNKIRKFIYYLIFFASVYSLYSYKTIDFLGISSCVSIRDFLIFSNPFKITLLGTETTLYIFLFVIHKLLTIIIGYQLITSLKFYTRRK